MAAALAQVVAKVDMVLAVLAMVVVLLRIRHESAAGVRCHECDELQSAHGPGTLHSLSLSRRRLLGARPRNVPPDDQHGPLAQKSVDPGQSIREHEEQSDLPCIVGMA